MKKIGIYWGEYTVKIGNELYSIPPKLVSSFDGIPFGTEVECEIQEDFFEIKSIIK